MVLLDDIMKQVLHKIYQLDRGNGASEREIIDSTERDTEDIQIAIRDLKREGAIYSPHPNCLMIIGTPGDYIKEDIKEEKKEKNNFKYQNGDIAFIIEDFFMTMCDIEPNGDHSDGDDRVSKKPIEIKTVKFKVKKGNGREGCGTVMFYRDTHKELVKKEGSYLIIVYTYKNAEIRIHAFKHVLAEDVDYLIKKSKSKNKIGLRWSNFFKKVSEIPLFTISETNEFIKFKKRQRKWLKFLNDLSVTPLRIARNLTKRWNYFSDAKYLVQHRTILHKEIIFDLDYKKWEDIKSYGRKIIDTLNDLKIPHLLAYSGGKGIHIHVFFRLTDDQNFRLYFEKINIDTSFIRKQIFYYILKKAQISIPSIGKNKSIDTSCVDFSDTSKGHLIRSFGGKNKSFKTLMLDIPEERPVIKYHYVNCTSLTY